ncbi:hypothetical protein VTL71DRAFT_4246, partial [Oculimacula yallundae]
MSHFLTCPLNPVPSLHLPRPLKIDIHVYCLKSDSDVAEKFKSESSRASHRRMSQVTRDELDAVSQHKRSGIFLLRDIGAGQGVRV